MEKNIKKEFIEINDADIISRLETLRIKLYENNLLDKESNSLISFLVNYFSNYFEIVEVIK